MRLQRLRSTASLMPPPQCANGAKGTSVDFRRETQIKHPREIVLFDTVSVAFVRTNWPTSPHAGTHDSSSWPTCLLSHQAARAAAAAGCPKFHLPQHQPGVFYKKNLCTQGFSYVRRSHFGSSRKQIPHILLCQASKALVVLPDSCLKHQAFLFLQGHHLFLNCPRHNKAHHLN